MDCKLKFDVHLKTVDKKVQFLLSKQTDCKHAKIILISKEWEIFITANKNAQTSENRQKKIVPNYSTSSFNSLLNWRLHYFIHYTWSPSKLSERSYTLTLTNKNRIQPSSGSFEKTWKKKRKKLIEKHSFRVDFWTFKNKTKMKGEVRSYNQEQ